MGWSFLGWCCRLGLLQLCASHPDSSRERGKAGLRGDTEDPSPQIGLRNRRKRGSRPSQKAWKVPGHLERGWFELSCLHTPTACGAKGKTQ